MSKVVPTPVPVADMPSRRSSEPSDDSVDDSSDNDALITQALNPDGTPRRPMNAFMIFARRRRPEITANNPPLRTGEISKVLSSEWAAMSSESKQFYLDRARKLKDNFNARWPDYVYRRRPNNSRKRKRVESSVPPVVRRQSPGHDPVVPSSKIKYEDGYQHPVLPHLPSTNAPLTMMYLGETDHRSGMLSGYHGLLPAPYARSIATPSLASSILTSASTSPRSVSSTLHSSYRYNEHMPMSHSPPHRRPGGWKDAVLSPESSVGAFNSPYVGGLGYLPNKSNGSFDDYSSACREQDTRHGDWTPPHAVRNTLALPTFASNPSYASFASDEPASAASEFHPYPTTPHLDYPPNSGLVPVHPHFQRS
ncbi:HMG (high mobility group) box protein [Rhizoctonia solani 123E]|uniref:HMG (High mobility group) box protein n=1 Tax=Rhizoctonia solani 123E TaxID=1423351 RepID=A0A074S7D9_9AGAM|nr:HMG (high mobility group) box protein [Rhizoctonia solani 123E]